MNYTWDNFVSGTFKSHWLHGADSSERNWMLNLNGTIEPYDWQYDHYAEFLDYQSGSTSGFNMSSNYITAESGDVATIIFSSPTFQFEYPNMLAVTEKVWNCFVDGDWASDIIYSDVNAT